MSLLIMKLSLPNMTGHSTANDMGRLAVAVIFILSVVLHCNGGVLPVKSRNTLIEPKTEAATINERAQMKKSEIEWKSELTAEQYHILREKGTERPFTGKFNAHKENGVYVCAGCGTRLFSSDTKYDSGSGWPSFYDALDNGKVGLQSDYSHGMTRTEIFCKTCGGHLGHVFDDGPNPTGRRYCVNSVSLDFLPESSSKETQ